MNAKFEKKASYSEKAGGNSFLSIFLYFLIIKIHKSEIH